MLGSKNETADKGASFHHHLYPIGNPATLLAYRLWHTAYQFTACH